jgi:hypothetical protein
LRQKRLVRESPGPVFGQVLPKKLTYAPHNMQGGQLACLYLFCGQLACLYLFCVVSASDIGCYQNEQNDESVQPRHFPVEVDGFLQPFAFGKKEERQHW